MELSSVISHSRKVTLHSMMQLHTVVVSLSRLPIFYYILFGRVTSPVKYYLDVTSIRRTNWTILNNAKTYMIQHTFYLCQHICANRAICVFTFLLILLSALLLKFNIYCLRFTLLTCSQRLERKFENIARRKCVQSHDTNIM